MRFRLLGPVRTREPAGWSAVNAPQQRSVLALLLIEAGRTVSTDRLVHEIWGEHPPRAAVSTVQNYVLRLRRRLGAGGMLVSRERGYELVVDDDQVDARWFERLSAAGRHSLAAGRIDAATSQLREALALWHGPALADVAPTPRVAAEAARLEQLRLAVTEDRLAAELDLGLHREVVEELRRLVAAEPLRERLHAQLMLALYRNGQRAEALAAYRAARTRLVGELGLEPGAEMRDLHRAILADDVPRLAAGAAGAAGAADRVTPAQLPAGVADFTGRRRHLRRLDSLLEVAGRRRALRIATIIGTAGVGKSALALHWAHVVRDRFPDGQLFVDLRGHADEPATTAIEALAWSLSAMGIAADQIPSDVDTAAALYRSLMSGRRMLVVLDDAAHVDQVRPLLPAGDGCVVLVTGRDELPGLVAREGALRIHLDLMSPAEADAVLTRLLGTARAGAEPAALAELARLCGHLPLALRIAAANLVTTVERPIADYVRELAGHEDRLSALEVAGDRSCAVRVAFQSSYSALAPGARRLFRLMGLAPGPDVSAVAAAALAGLPVGDASVVLDELTTAHLVEERAPGRFGLHDLLRLYAAARTEVEDDRRDRAAALARLYDHYLRTVSAAVMRLSPQMLRLPSPWADPGVIFDDDESALAWLDTERANLVAAVQRAAENGPRPAAWRLADALRGYLYLRLPFVEWQTVANVALDAARAARDRRAQAAAHFSLAMLEGFQARYPAAIDQQATALDLSRRAGWTEGESAALCNLGLVYWALGRLVEAVDHFTRYIAMERRSGNPLWLAGGLANLGLALLGLGRLDRAERHQVRALDLYRRVGTHLGEATARTRLGDVQRWMGRFDEALENLTLGHALFRGVGDRHGEAAATLYLALVHGDTGRSVEALAAADTAVALACEIGDQRIEAEARTGRASVHGQVGEYARAIDGHTRAMELAVGVGNRYLQATALIGLARAHDGAGDRATAVEHATTALTIAEPGQFGLLIANARAVLRGPAP